MVRYSCHGGHNEKVQGANYGTRKEHIMDRQVKNAVVAKLRALGHTVYDDTDEVGTTQSQNLSNIVRNCNSHDVDLVISFHLNSFNTSANGVEVLYYDQKDLAAKISSQLSQDIGWYNRGAKKRTDLYVLKNTKAPAILIELGFIDNDADMAKWNVDKIANSIVYALTGKTVGGSSGEGNVGKQRVISGGFYIDYANEVAQKMVETGCTGSIVVQADGIAYVRTDLHPNVTLDKLTAWFDSRSWWYKYEQ
ncbi:N-acetylmuramoyl-L-alanine amidase [Bacillus sp. XF8]|uniref:N-acetylmuramoyl-L-alanine amidase n=1 Tax=Bacillus sp. XF8 TaxID=2819289 RepID=UPI001AA02D94|nr:N-acetylmuramoyl-L-alanine amidase [Bacillus sp. XF8]MBO1582261.1 N-acetylmuramoyl-L-alanine amidase [Bacillus sp. XF8]